MQAAPSITQHQPPRDAVAGGVAAHLLSLGLSADDVGKASAVLRAGGDVLAAAWAATGRDGAALASLRAALGDMWAAGGRDKATLEALGRLGAELAKQKLFILRLVAKAM